MFRTLAFATIAIVAIAGSASAQSGDDGAPNAVSIHYSDLNLNQGAGAGVMLARIESAASTACGGQPDAMMLGRRASYDRCRKETVAHAVAQLNAPSVTTLAGLSTPVRLASQ